MGNITAHPDYGSTYDLTHGWLMWGMEYYYYYGGLWLKRDTSELHYTKDGNTFDTIPVPSWVKGAYGTQGDWESRAQGRCLQTLDNGGDIFLAGNSSYIFRNTDSTWEKQPDLLLDQNADEVGGKLKRC